MTPRQRSTRAAARIRRLACLDAGGPQFAPMLLHELADLLACDSGGFMHLDAAGKPDFYSDAPEVQAVVPLYLDERMQAAERQVARSYAVAAREDFGPQMREQLITVPESTFHRSDYYNLLLRPAGIEDCISLIARRDDGQPVGALKLYRNTRRANFHREDVAPLARLEPFVARLLTPREPIDIGRPDVRQGRCLLVTTPEGHILWQSTQAQALMATAFGRDWYHRSSLPPRCTQVLNRLHGAQQAYEDAELPLIRWQDVRGTFTLRASRLGTPAAAREAVALELEHRRPWRLWLAERLLEMALPDRQFELAYWLAHDHGEQRIATRLGVTMNTLVYHRRRLYERLAVHSRKELIHLLARDECRFFLQ